MLTFRDATADQAGLISHIYATSWRKTYRGHIAQHYLDRLPDEYWVPSIRSWLSSGQLYGLMVYDDDKPVGCCIYGRGRDEDYGDWCEIVSLYLLPDTMRQADSSRNTSRFRISCANWYTSTTSAINASDAFTASCKKFS